MTPQHQSLKSALVKLEKMNDASEALRDLCQNAASMDVNQVGFCQLLFMINNGYHDAYDALAKINILEEDLLSIEKIKAEISSHQAVLAICEKVKHSGMGKSHAAYLRGKLKSCRSQLTELEQRVAQPL
jgi:hypothetical protein